MRRLAFAVAVALLPAGCGSASPATTMVVSPSPSVSVASGHAPTRTFTVGTSVYDFQRGKRPLTTIVYYPNNAPGPFPIVLFAHGFGGTPEAYSALLKRWASAGFVVAAPTFPHTSWGVAKPDLLDVVNQPADISAVLSSLVGLPESDGLRPLIDPSRAAVAGHSAGAITALGEFTADGPVKRDKRFIAGIVLAGNALGIGSTFSGTAAPLLFVHAADDQIVPFWTGLGAYNAVPWPRAMLKLTGNEHTDPYLAKSDKQFAVVANATMDFLRWSLYSDATARTRLLEVRGLDAHL